MTKHNLAHKEVLLLKKCKQAFFCIAFVLGLLIGFNTPSAYACSRGPTTLEAEFLTASAIFTAKVTNVEAVYPSQRVASVEALNIYKGKAPTFVVTNDDSDQCGAGIEPGKTYLFFAQGWAIPYVSVFDAHAANTDQTNELVRWLAERMKEQPTPSTESLLAYRQGEIKLFLNKQDIGLINKSFITDNSVYVSTSFINDMFPDSTFDWQNQTRSIVRDNDTFVPLRAAAETLGYEVEWIDATSSVILHTPLEQRSGSKTLAMRYIVNVGLEGTLEIDRLTADEITYRSYNGHLPEGAEVKPQTHPFSDVLKAELGYRQYILQFFVKMEQGEVRLLVASDLLSRIESDPSFREKVGAKLGEKIETLPAHRLLTTADFE
jgi:hypothetical protein